MAANGTCLLRIVYLGGDCVLRLAYHHVSSASVCACGRKFCQLGDLSRHSRFYIQQLPDPFNMNFFVVVVELFLENFCMLF